MSKQSTFPLVPATPQASRRALLFGLGAAGVVASPAVASSLLGAPAAPLAEIVPSGLAPAVATPSPDAALLQLVEKYFAAEAKWQHILCDQSRQEPKRPPIPDVLQFRPEDETLGLWAGPANHRPTNWLGYHVNQLLDLESLKCRAFETIQPPDGAYFYSGGGGEVVRYIEPSKAARDRAVEIVAAYDKLQRSSEKELRKERAMERKSTAAMYAVNRLSSKIRRTKALTVAGLVAKARVASYEAEQYSGDEHISASIVRDLLTLDADALAKIGAVQS
jgi:hypothetical protein